MNFVTSNFYPLDGNNMYILELIHEEQIVRLLFEAGSNFVSVITISTYYANILRSSCQKLLACLNITNSQRCTLFFRVYTIF
jgi:hypothetical protein